MTYIPGTYNNGNVYFAWMPFSFETNEVLVNSLKSTTKILTSKITRLLSLFSKVALDKATTIGVLVTDTAFVSIFHVKEF